MGTVDALLVGLPMIGGTPDKVRAKVQGECVVITGASRGIGREMARRLACVGARVVGIARSRDILAELQDQITSGGGYFHAMVGDLRDFSWAESAGREILVSHGVPSLVISNAGHSIHRSLAEYTSRFHDVERTIGVNYLGAVALTLPLVEAMMNEGRGHLIAISSTSARFPIPRWSTYTASKGAYDLWLSCVAPELRVAGVAVTNVLMPRVVTAMSAPTSGRYPVPELSVNQAADILCRAIVTRQRLVVPWWVRAASTVAAACPTTVQRAWELALKSGVQP